MKTIWIALMLVFVTIPVFGKNLKYTCIDREYLFECSDYEGVLSCYQCSEIYRTHNGLKIKKPLLACDCIQILIRVDKECIRGDAGGVD